MSIYTKRTEVCLRPEWQAELEQLKKESFSSSTRTEMYRYLIRLGLDSVKSEQTCDGLKKPPL